MRARIVNNSPQPISLSGGVQLAAAGTKGSEREVSGVNDRINRLAEKGLVSIHLLASDEARATAETPAAVEESGGGKKRSDK